MDLLSVDIEMPPSRHFLNRCGELKKMLVDYAQGAEFKRERDLCLQEQALKRGKSQGSEYGNDLDAFVLEYRLSDGKGMVDRFLDDHPELSPEDVALITGWTKVFASFFQVERNLGDSVLLKDVVNGLEYPVHSNMGSRALAQLTRGTHLVARLVPAQDVWLISGFVELFPPDTATEFLRGAAGYARRSPRHVFKNPELLAEAQELMKQHHQEFKDFFGSDLIIIPGHELPDRMAAFMRYQTFDAKGEDGLSPAERHRLEYGNDPIVPEHQFDADLLSWDTVGAIADPVEGINFFPEMGLVEAAFANPELAKSEPHQDAVAGYLEGPEVSPLPLRRLAQRFPDGATAAIRNAFPDRADFVWERDAEALMLVHKPDYREEPLPSIIPLSSELSAAMRAAQKPAASNGAPLSRGKPGRNDKCPCASGLKYKKCCGKQCFAA